jgi:SAM-dependent methyltransferase
LSLAYDTREDHPLLAALGLSTGRFAGANLDVHAADEMLLHYWNLHGGDRAQALVLYFDSGRRIWRSMSEILQWRFGRIGLDLRLLDFASGYGRVTRFALLDLPPEAIWVADVYAEGVRFQEETFGVHGLVSHADPERFACDGGFDAILVSSLFTHLPAATFAGWLRRLFGLLRPGGVLAFSVHGEDLVPPGRELPPSGILFDRSSESGSLPTEQYGTTWVSEPFVRRVLAESAPGSSAHRIPRGLANFQDLWIVVPEPGCDFSGLRLRAGPEGFVEHCSTAAGRLRMSGWVVDRIRRAVPRELRVTLGGEPIHVLSRFHPRPEVSALLPYEQVTGHGWQLEVDLPAGALERNGALNVEVIDAAGEAFSLYEDPLLAALLRSAQLDRYSVWVQLQKRTEEIQALEARIAGMQASRFWKLRNAWFKVKRGLGLTEEA